MAKLGSLKPRVGGLSQRIGSAPQARDQHRSTIKPWRAWYKTARWERLRQQVRLRDLFMCRRCGRLCAGKGESAVDHKRPHRGDPALFWDLENLQLLCTPCHSGAKQAEEAKDIAGVWY